MQIVELRKIGNSSIVTLSTAVVEALHLHDNDKVAGDRIVLTRASTDFQNAWNAYQDIELRYRNANRKLSE